MSKKLKCWKKIKTKFVNEKFWRNKSNGGVIYLIDEMGSSDKSRKGFWITSNVDKSLYSGKRFDTSSQSLAFAKSYMRKHDRC